MTGFAFIKAIQNRSKQKTSSYQAIKFSAWTVTQFSQANIITTTEYNVFAFGNYFLQFSYTGQN